MCTCFFSHLERGKLDFSFLCFNFFSFGFLGLRLLLGRCGIRSSLCLSSCSFRFFLRRCLLSSSAVSLGFFPCSCTISL